jgi:hypothetical protein
MPSVLEKLRSSRSSAPIQVRCKPVASVSVFLYQVLTQVWCKTNGLENSRGEQTSAEQFEAGAAIHLPLEGFQPVDVTFHRTVAERLL